MWDKHTVQRIANENEFYELVLAAEEKYSDIIKNYSEWMKLITEEDVPFTEVDD